MIETLYSLLNRIGFTDPLHALIVHMPMGLVIGAFLMFLIAVFLGRKNLILTARHVAIMAFVFVFPTILFGVFDWLHFFKGALIQPIKVKMVLASIVLVVLGAGIVLGSGIRVGTAAMASLYAAAFLSVVGLGYFGAKLVYGEWSPRSQSAPLIAASPEVLAGEKIFAAGCQSCHARGGNIVAPDLPLKSSKRLDSFASFAGFIRNPQMPNGSAGEMPPFSTAEINDEQAKTLLAYIKASLPGWK